MLDPELLDSLRRLLSTTADALKKLGSGLGNAPTRAVQAYDAITDLLADGRMTKLSGRIAHMRRENDSVAFSTEEFLSAYERRTKQLRAHPTIEALDRFRLDHSVDMKWDTLISSISETFGEVDKIYERIEKEQSDYVLHESYEQLIAAVSMRHLLLQKLKELPKPKTPDELKTLKGIVQEYYRLKENLYSANRLLVSYIRSRQSERRAARKKSAKPRARKPSAGGNQA